MKNSQMRLILLAALVASVFAENGSLECYDGWNNGEQVVVACKCDVDEMAQFIKHVGNVCFGDGTIPQEFDPYFDFGDGCSQYGNGNNYQQDACEEEQQMQNFWCGCLSTYMKKYGKFSDSCWIPDISEAMRELAGGTMESAWDEGACEWWEYSVERVLPNDISIQLGANSETCVTPTTAPTQAAEADAGGDEADGADGRRRLQADCNNGSTSQTALGSITLGATQDSNTGAIVAEDFQIDLDYSAIKTAYKDATGNQLMCGIKWENGYAEYEDWNDGEMLAWEIRRGWVFDDNDSSKGQATRYGAACSQDYTGDVLVTYAYATEVNDYGYIEEEDGERSVFWGDLTETYGPLYVGYDGTSIQYPRGCNQGNGYGYNNGNNNNNNNNQNGQCEGQSEEGVREGANLAQALSYLLYNPNDVDMYSIVISCGGENDRAESQENYYNNNNNNQNGSEDCEYEEKEMCEGTVSQWAKPIVCSNFFVASDQIVNTPAPEPDSSKICKGLQEENNSDCESLSSEDDCGSDERCEWVSAGGWNDGNNNGGGNSDGNNGGGAGMELGDGMVAVSETENTIKTVAIIVLAAGCVALCFLWSCSKKSSYASVEEGGAARDTTPLRDDQL